MPGVWELGLVLGIAFYAFIIWLAWTLVSAVKGIQEELKLVREELNTLARDRKP